MQKVLEQDVHFKVYNWGRHVATVKYVKETQKTDVQLFEKNAIPCFPEENIEWKDISRFLCTRINYRGAIVPLEDIKKQNGKMVGDHMRLKFYVR